MTPTAADTSPTADRALTDRVLGGLLGVHAGDSLGATHEFSPWTAIHRADDPGWRLRDVVGGGPFGWEPGQATDDTSLTVAVVRAYLHPDGFALSVAGDHMLAWFEADPPDVGGATRTALTRYADHRDPRRSGAGHGAAGNGSLMRCIATGLVRPDAGLRRAESQEISAITHDDHRCRQACVAYNEVVALLLDGAGPDEAVAEAIALMDGIGARDVADALDAGRGIDIAARARHGGNPFGGSGFVLHTLALGVAAVVDGRPLADVLADVVHLGGDTDTNGAVAGGLLGVRDGAAAIPEAWRARLEHGDELARAVPGLLTLRAASPPTLPPVVRTTGGDVALGRLRLHPDRLAELTTPRPSGSPLAAGDDLLRDRSRGALVGTAIGDALGRPAEGMPASVVAERYGTLDRYLVRPGRSHRPGEWTDDTQMTIAVAECLIAGGGRLDPADLAERFVEWGEVARGPGSTCLAAVANLVDGAHWSNAGIDSAGNGAAMRAAPVGLVHRHDPSTLAVDAALSSIVTHDHGMAVASAVAHAAAVALLVSEPPGTLDVDRFLTRLVAQVEVAADPGAPERDWHRRPGKSDRPITLAERLRELPEWLHRPDHEARAYFFNGAFVLESLPSALLAFLASPDDPERAVVRAVMGGRDADTVASMTAAYAGAWLGESAFPERWRDDGLERVDDLRALADRLLDLSTSAR